MCRPQDFSSGWNNSVSTEIRKMARPGSSARPSTPSFRTPNLEKQNQHKATHQHFCSQLLTSPLPALSSFFSSFFQKNLESSAKLCKMTYLLRLPCFASLLWKASCFPQWLHKFTLPPVVYEGSLFFSSLITFGICILFDDSHSYRFEVGSH